MVKYLAVDYGEKRCGFAVSDAEGRGAFPRPALAVRGRKHFLAATAALAQEENAGAVVLGLPLRLDGGENPASARLLGIAASLARRIGLPLYLMPEALSSCEAEERLREAGKKGKKLKNALDGAAAAAILESFRNLPEDRKRLLMLPEAETGRE
ncbi:MAG: Holliday junction resolvase RuvX [Desulfovibrio sp.]|jgi:putative Holliday junction resolvase|nr:Holliday junction resolvase RuvX [Desulfovibrio sp.]